MLHQKRNRALTLAVLALGFYGASAALAAVTPGGDTTVAVVPSRDTTVGITGIGTLDIDGGTWLADSFGFLGYEAGSVGTATVSGVGSRWTNTSGMHVGYYGSGTLSIAAGGSVSSGNFAGAYDTYLGNKPGSIGTATVGGGGT